MPLPERILTLLPPLKQLENEGEIRVKGESVQFTGTREAEEHGISIIHQELNLVEELTVAANIFLGRELTSGWGMLNDHQMEVEADLL